MLLVIDIGNTNIVLGVMNKDEILFSSRFTTEKNFSIDQYISEIKNILFLNNFDFKLIKDTIISSVVPPVLDIFKEVILKIFGKAPLVVGPGIKTGINILIYDPAQLGSDLVVTAVAGVNLYKMPLIIIDMGTATTVSVIDLGKKYIGGLIIPGAKISLDALYEKTAQLQHISLDTPKNIIGKNTIECMQSGVIYGSAAMIDGIIENIETELANKVTTIITGGISKYVVPYCKKDIIYDENLMLKGLNFIYQQNK